MQRDIFKKLSNMINNNFGPINCWINLKVTLLNIASMGKFPHLWKYKSKLLSLILILLFLSILEELLVEVKQHVFGLVV